MRYSSPRFSPTVHTLNSTYRETRVATVETRAPNLQFREHFRSPFKTVQNTCKFQSTILWLMYFVLQVVYMLQPNMQIKQIWHSHWFSELPFNKKCWRKTPAFIYITMTHSLLPRAATGLTPLLCITLKLNFYQKSIAAAVVVARDLYCLLSVLFR